MPWIEGERATPDNIEPASAAEDLARFVRCLRPPGLRRRRRSPAGPGTGKRGLSVHVWVEGVEKHTASFQADPLVRRALQAWEEVLEAPEWDTPPAWFHGDLAGNLIARRGRLVGAIDSGYGIGDPACDLAPGWALFRGEARRVFFAELGLDQASQARALGWVLGPDLIGMGYYREVPHLLAHCRGGSNLPWLTDRPRTVMPGLAQPQARTAVARKRSRRNRSCHTGARTHPVEEEP